MRPFVSVIVPMYNAAPFIVETLESIIASTYRPIEAVVVDDGSTDNSLAVAQAFAAEHKEVRILHQSNAGVSAARNHAIRESKGEYILPVDADDKISPTYIEEAVKAMANGVRVVGCRAEYFGAKQGEWQLPEYSPELLARKNMIHASSMFRKADWEQVKGYCEEEIYREDWEFWLSLMELGGTYVRLSQTGLYYRVQSGGRRNMAKQQKQAIVDAINRRHPAYLQKYLAGPLHYHRSWSRFLNLFRSEKQVGDFNRWTEGQILYDKRNTLRLYENKVIKQFATPPLWKGIIYGLFTKSKAHRSYEYAKILGGLTPSPIAYREVRICGVLRESYYVCLKSECAYTFNDLIKNKTFPNRDIILKQIGKFTARLHQQGIVHRDYSGGNILFNGDGSIIHVIDLNRIRLCSPDRKERLQNFERLNIDRAALETMVTAYAEAMNEDALYDCRYVIEHRWRKHVKQGITNL